MNPEQVKLLGEYKDRPDVSRDLAILLHAIDSLELVKKAYVIGNLKDSIPFESLFDFSEHYSAIRRILYETEKGILTR
jgi:hypothetical protein